jgi:phage N-6-adenine-methyltransferase
MQIEILEELRTLIPPLAKEELQQLEENIVRDGCRDPLVIWNPPPKVLYGLGYGTCKECKHGKRVSHGQWQPGLGNWRCPGCGYGIAPMVPVLIDGHNRYEICNRLRIDFRTEEMEFESLEEAKNWIDLNQLGRRNLTPDQMSLLRGRRYNRSKNVIPNAEGIGGKSGKIVNRQNDGQQTTAERLANQHGVSPKTIERDGQFAEAVEVLELEREVLAGEVAAPKQAIVEAAKPIIEAKKQHAKWEAETKAKPLAQIPEPPQPTADDIKKAKSHVVHNSGENEWYTPLQFLDAVREVLGTIDLDPASCELAQKNVKATKFYDSEADGLSKTWRGKVYMNPPYSKDLCFKFATKLLDSLNDGDVTAAIVLVNNATETVWAQSLLDDAAGVCFPGGRIKFLDKTGKPANTPLQGQMFVYFGGEVEKFRRVFQGFGTVLLGNGCGVADAKSGTLVKQFKKSTNRLDVLKQLAESLKPAEKSVLADWIAS